MIQNKHLVDAKIADLTNKFKMNIKPDVNPKINIRYDLKGSTAAGTCRAISVAEQRFEIRLNPVMLDVLGEEYVDEVVAHEFCHAARHMAYPPDSPYGRRKPHGPYFYAVGKKLGVNLNRTTNLLQKLLERAPQAASMAVATRRTATRQTTNRSFGIARHTRSIEALCPHCNAKINITKNRLTRMKAGARYFHSTCGANRYGKALVIA